MLASLMLMGSMAFAAGTPTEEELLAVEPQNVPKLWTLKRYEKQSEVFGRLRFAAGCAAVSFVIEPNGRVSSAKVLRAFPHPQVGEAAVDMLDTWRFEPTKLNAKRRVPVYTTQLFSFTSALLNGEVGTHRKPKAVDMAQVVKACEIESLKLGG